MILLVELAGLGIGSKGVVKVSLSMIALSNYAVDLCPEYQHVF